MDYFIKHKLRAKYYIRYVDDFIILHRSKKQLEIWKQEINNYIQKKLKLKLHSQKSRVISLSKGIDFVGFRIYWNHKLLRKRNIKNIENKINLFNKNQLGFKKLIESFQGWQAYAMWANTYNLNKNLTKKILNL